MKRLITCLIICLALSSLSPTTATFASETATIEIVDPSLVKLASPRLPDISFYSEQWVRERIGKPVKPNIALVEMYEQSALREFVKGERAIEWINRQDSRPKAIALLAGQASLTELYKAINNDKYLEQVEPGIYIARIPVMVSTGATLLIDGNLGEKALRLSQTKGAFLVSAGNLFIMSSKIVGWSEELNKPAPFIGHTSFRPFITGWSNSHTYLVNSHFVSLGYFSTKSYGITLTKSIDNNQVAEPAAGAPKGWIIESIFDDIYYGFYCYEAEDVVIVRNTYRDNVIYGIDPHDYSKRLIIGENTVFGTREKHGIIVSREVDDSWIFRNKSYNNKLAGFVLDRQSSNNVVAFNHAYSNGSDGLSIYESPDNVIYGNLFDGNQKHGIRIRNSESISLGQNVIRNNKQQGIYAYVDDFDPTERDLVHDPYDKNTSFSSYQDQFIGNGQGLIAMDKLHPMKIYRPGISGSMNSKSMTFNGALANLHTDLYRLLLKEQQAVAITGQGH